MRASPEGQSNERPAVLEVGAIRSLEGVHIAFTGILTRRRSEAVRAARKAGAVVHGGASGIQGLYLGIDADGLHLGGGQYQVFTSAGQGFP